MRTQSEDALRYHVYVIPLRYVNATPPSVAYDGLSITLGAGNIFHIITSCDFSMIKLSVKDFDGTPILTSALAVISLSNGMAKYTFTNRGTFYTITYALTTPTKDATGNTLIENAEQLQNIGRCPSYPPDGQYKQIDDIDLSVISSFKPIGETGNPFTGKYDGNDYLIRSLKIRDQPLDVHLGLFRVAQSATITRVVVIYAALYGTESSQVYCGVLVGNSIGATITKSHAWGTIMGGRDNQAGGLIGGGTGTVRESYASVDITGDSQLGGLIGFSRGFTIENCYATGNVSGYREIGGLVGHLMLSRLSNSYATGIVSASAVINPAVHGLVGQKSNNSTVSNSYYPNTRVQSGIGFMPSEFPGLPANFTKADFDWDFENTWHWVGNGQWPVFKF